MYGAWTNQFYGYGYTNDRFYEPTYGSNQKEICVTGNLLSILEPPYNTEPRGRRIQ